MGPDGSPNFKALAQGGVSALTVAGSWLEADAERKALRMKADQLQERGRAAYSDATRSAAEEIRQGKILQSNARAAMAGGGGVTTDQGAEAILGRIGGDASYNAFARMFEGRTRQEDFERQAATARREARLTQRAGTLRTVRTALSGAGRTYEAYQAGKY